MQDRDTRCNRDGLSVWRRPQALRSGRLHAPASPPARGPVQWVAAPKLAMALLVPALTIAAAGCGGGTSASTSAPAPPSALGSTGGAARSASASATGKVQVSTKSLSGLGTVLVDRQGRTLYVFVPDEHKRVTCLSTCAQLWPPVRLSKNQKPGVSGQASRSLLGSDLDPEGGQVLTYAGWPLYTYVADSGPGSANGQGLNANGGLWYVLSPSGAVISKAP
jgi:predicted lipoprotein with Yx(FWY)xxD motif